MNWILVVLQVTAPMFNSVAYGWKPIGEFSTYEACQKASVQLIQNNTDNLKGIAKFACIQK